MYEILIVDDDAAILELLQRLLSNEGYRVFAASCVGEAKVLLDNVYPHLILLDVGLPEVDGITFCGQLRQMPKFRDTPIVFLTGQSAPESAARALDAGGDDYLRKPFAIRELIARIKAHFRRLQVAQALENFSDTIEFFPDTYQIRLHRRLITLTPVEFSLLHYMCTSGEGWHSIQDLLVHVWQYPQGVGNAALVRNHIRNLRMKIEEDPEHPRIVISRHGRGYRVALKIAAKSLS